MKRYKVGEISEAYVYKTYEINEILLFNSNIKASDVSTTLQRYTRK